MHLKEGKKTPAIHWNRGADVYSRLLRRCVAAAWAAGLAACGGTGGESVERADSAGVEIVMQRGPDVPLEWTFTRLFSLGGKDTEEESFYQVGSTTVGVDAAGNVYVLDTSAKRVVVFDADGALLRMMGGEGGGPGEMQFPFALTVTPEGVVEVFDIGKRGFVRFGQQGEILEEVRTTFRYGGGLMRYVAGSLTVPVRDFDPERHMTTHRLLSIAGDDTTEIVVLEGPVGDVVTLESCGMQFSGMAPIFWPGLRWSPAGAAVAVAVEAAYVVTMYETGSPVRSVRRDIAPSPATDAAARATIGESMRVVAAGGERICDAAEVVEKRGVADVIPTIADLTEGVDGTLWVKRTTGPADPQPIDVFGADGAYLGTLPEGSPYPVAVGGDRIAVVEQDEMDVQRLVVYEIGR
jgi:hypothetical protein